MVTPHAFASDHSNHYSRSSWKLQNHAAGAMEDATFFHCNNAIEDPILWVKGSTCCDGVAAFWPTMRLLCCLARHALGIEHIKVKYSMIKYAVDTVAFGSLHSFCSVDETSYSILDALADLVWKQTLHFCPAACQCFVGPRLDASLPCSSCRACRRTWGATELGTGNTCTVQGWSIEQFIETVCRTI